MTDDIIHRFSFAAAPIRGQWVRLDRTLHDVFDQRGYPTPVEALLAEMLAAVSLAADGIKFQGAVALQARGDGPVTTVLAECRAQHLLRGIGRWDAVTPPQRTSAGLTDLLGNGQMVLSLVPDADARGDTNTYQGIVELTEGSFADNLERYFENSEQLPTQLRIAYDGSRVTGLLLQRLPAPPTASEMALEQHEALWREAVLLLGTLTETELARWSIEDLLRRLFHEHTLTLQPGRALQFSCTCSRARTDRMLSSLPKPELVELLAERGSVEVTCEVCGAEYRYDGFDTLALFEPAPTALH
ncbi:MAG: Hsp33 family molecular chaperone HslO [Gammaproteobacteria bacterium]